VQTNTEMDPDRMAIDAATQSAPEPSDTALLREVIGGSQDAFASLYDRHVGVVYGAALRVNRDPSAAAEVVPETFLVLWDRAETFDATRGALASWLATIARNRAVDHARSAARHQRATAFASFGLPDVEDASTLDWLTGAGSLVAAGSPEIAPEDAALETETREVVREALASIPAHEREILLLAYEGGLSQSEIADRLGWPLGTVKTRTRRALRRLRDRLERSGSELPARPADQAGPGSASSSRMTASEPS
jgi:RNA polymerase sigma-70 factor (ECF subfamily)